MRDAQMPLGSADYASCSLRYLVEACCHPVISSSESLFEVCVPHLLVCTLHSPFECACCFWEMCSICNLVVGSSVRVQNYANYALSCLLRGDEWNAVHEVKVVKYQLFELFADLGH